MSHDQCHSTVHGEKQKPGREELARSARALQRVNGQASWRSLDEMADTPAFREHLEREFPSAMAELVGRERMDLSSDPSGDPTGATGKSGESRREFLKLMGASVALAGVAATMPGCRRPDHKIYPYSQDVPEEIIPGKPLFYTTSMARWDGGAEGLLVETHEGRPTKIEGNPLHPINQGKSTAWALSSIMCLYDPDRLMGPAYAKNASGHEATWDDFRAWAGDHFKGVDSDQGAKLAFILEKSDSPTRAAAVDRIKKKWPKATIALVSPAEATGEFEGTQAAFGKPMRQTLAISGSTTRVVLSLDRDFVHREASELTNARQLGAARGVMGTKDAMTRLYCVESCVSACGGAADHRLRLSPSRVSAFAVEIAKNVVSVTQDPALKGVLEACGKVGGQSGGQAGAQAWTDEERAFLEECAKDLLDPANRGKSAVVCGASQPGAVHALVACMNQALENVGQSGGKSVAYWPVDAQWATPGTVALEEIAGRIKNALVTTLVCVNTNPAYDAPGHLGFAELLNTGTLTTITQSTLSSETAQRSLWALDCAHYLESWGDTRAINGSIAPVQPMIKPLYGSLSELEFLWLLGGKDFAAPVDGYDVLREVWQATLANALKASGADFDTFLRRCLHNGIVPGTEIAKESPKVNAADVVKALGAFTLAPAPTKDSLDVTFAIGNLADGRFANVGWLQELPEMGTRVVWDNPVLLSPKTANELGLLPVGFSEHDASDMYTKPTYPHGRVATLTLGGKSVTTPVWICPGLPDNTAVLTLGYGRSKAGLVGDGVGVNFYQVMTAQQRGVRSAAGAKLAGTGGTHMIVSTQNHWTLDSKTTVLRAVDLPAWQAHGDEVQDVVDTFYNTTSKINFAERLGELSHTPPNLSIRVNPYSGSLADPDAANVKPGNPNGPKYQRNQAPAFTQGPQWGMVIDQTSCVGCGACTIACQAENNIPVVGKKETAKGREMAWIRVDRYFTGEDFNNPTHMLHQPVACVHCENAPCEVVCPVNATVHGPEGLNYMTYNRCIGTRYCANNCPYKVRRYNWFDYGVTKFNGGYFFKDTVESIAPDRGGITGSGEHNKINPNLIPPRLRQKLDEISKMQKNPDVTVRSRGVMEKCTYCVQRINAARHDVKLADLRGSDGKHVVPEGFFQAACQQACPSDAIVFGDILDPSSRVHAARKNARSYSLLGYLNTRPRTSHMVRIMNPNPALVAKLDPERAKHMADPFHGAGGGEGGGHEGGHEGGAPSGAGEHGTTHSFFDRRKQASDCGYALSLRVLGGGQA